jgi:hypothetical protein
MINKLKEKSVEIFEEDLSRLLGSAYRLDDKDFQIAFETIIQGYNGIYFKKVSYDRLYRARKHNENELFLNNVDLVLAPNPKNPKIRINRGRMNHAGESVFYTSTNSVVALHEIEPNSNEIITLCKIEQPIPIENVMIIGFYKMSKSQLMGKTIENLKRRDDLSKNELQNSESLDKFIDNLCNSKNDDAYKFLTTFFNLGKKYMDIQCIAYPSIFYKLTEFSLEPVNFAFNYETYKRYCKPTSFTRLEIINIQHKHFIKLRITHEGKLMENGDILWEEVKNQKIENVTDVRSEFISDFLVKNNLTIH